MAVGAVALLTVNAAMGGCASSSGAETPEAGSATDGKLDPFLLRLVTQRPDSLIGVLVRASEAIDADRREALEDAGLRIGTVVDRIVTGRIRAGAVPRLARLPFVSRIEAARRLRPVRPETLKSRSD